MIIGKIDDVDIPEYARLQVRHSEDAKWDDFSSIRSNEDVKLAENILRRESKNFRLVDIRGTILIDVRF